MPFKKKKELNIYVPFYEVWLPLCTENRKQFENIFSSCQLTWTEKVNYVVVNCWSHYNDFNMVLINMYLLPDSQQSWQVEAKPSLTGSHVHAIEMQLSCWPSYISLIVRSAYY